MKRLFTLLAIILTTTLAHSQCQPIDCETSVEIEGTLTNTAYNESICFSTPSSATIANSVNWNSWEYLSFSGEIVVNQNINFGTTNNKVYTSGDIYLSYLSMNGSDTLFTDGNTEIGTLISNNSFGTTWNYIMTNSSVIVSGTEYYPNDTIITAGGTGNNVVVLECLGAPLIIHLISFKIINNQLEWETSGVTYTTLQQSSDSKLWNNIYTSSNSKDYYSINPNGETNQYYRLELQDEQETKYSSIISVISKTSARNSSYRCYDISGRVIEESQAQGLYIRVYDNGQIEKLYK